MALVALSGAAVGCVSGSRASGRTSGTPPPLCEPPCGQHASCSVSPGGGAACQCDLTVCPLIDGGAGATACTDLETDPHNCNGCGKQCAQGQNCALGECTCPASPNIALCETDGGFQCVDLTSDSNCGACGFTCGENQECAAADAGAADCVCVDGGPGTRFESCSGACTDTNLDPFNCGGCDIVCVSGACFPGDAGTGVCDCPAPYTFCGQDCVDTSRDPLHCGSCNDLCLSMDEIPQVICTLGHCFCGPTGRGTLCPDGTCAMLSTDPQNCGQCGKVCAPPAQDCVDGGCSPG